MESPVPAAPVLTRDSLRDQTRTQERQLVWVRLAVVALGIGFLIFFGERISGRLEIMALLAGVAAYSVLIVWLVTRLPSVPVAIAGVALDVVAVTGVVWLASNVPDSYLFYGLVILGAAIRFGLPAAVACSVLASALYVALVSSGAGAAADVRELLPVRVLYLVTLGVVAGLFSRIIVERAAENARLQRQLELEALRVVREQQLQATKDEFLSVVSHELRTPLTSIQGYSQLLEARLRDRATVKEMAHLQVILSQVTRMRRLVDDLLDVNRMERRGEIGITPMDFDLAALVRDAVARLTRVHSDRDVALTGPETIDVHLDRERMDQVVTNLLENAVKYSPDGGPIRVSVDASADDVRVCVADAGIGIPEADRERVFERFFQADDQHGRRRFGGLGLGLAISRAIVLAHGGTIWTEPNRGAGRGSIFAFRVPRVAVPTDEGGATAPGGGTVAPVSSASRG